MDIQDVRDANLESKHHIEELRVEWSNDFGASRNAMHERHVLEQLRPRRNLKKLTVASYGGSEFPSWMKDPSFPIMTHLILKDGKRCKSLPALGQLSSLKVLHIEGLNGVSSIDEEFYGGIAKPFPSLEYLKFEEMAEWEYWFCPDAINEDSHVSRGAGNAGMPQTEVISRYGVATIAKTTCEWLRRSKIAAS
ncbi:putative disease resistance RPP13-like protein 1 [Vitis vinifera]|uniref:putative disease resistance RPP13-like protein 1 n=1 Tax=Vitis vinifera TaxID=29760 RepID=UPI0008FEB7B4|nr:putative disease resistance RPP13-like protein 1 [Vitis vinifera]|eukprot:XP_019079636.1 PREDICTED: putative disease resistance RPP13-like protein 1 [Vitis vinifera]